MQYAQASAANQCVCRQQMPLQTCSTPGSFNAHLHLNTANWNSYFPGSEQENHTPLA